ncbi:ubiquitin-like-specific protease 1A [Tripterygium wilfordii]|uniref:ubiquitin-like-specific protease 1A n=1 Tax=Tripterygium wilfordii TaxID=458696 RepID=UPI0018F8089E|nr:ubiquitin-like-specific protease 1A [Tripterygium wilfordii]
MIDGITYIDNEEDDTEDDKLSLLTKLATEGQLYHSKRVKKRGPYQVSPYTDPFKKKIKVQPEFNPISEYPKEWEFEMDEFYKNLINQAKIIDLNVIDAKKDWFDTIMDQSKWLLDTHLDIAMDFIRKRMSENTDIFRQKCAIMDTFFHTYLNMCYQLYEENTEPSHWDGDNLLLHFIDRSRAGTIVWSNLEKNFKRRGSFAMIHFSNTSDEKFNNEMKFISTLIPKMLKRAKVIDDESPWPIEREPDVPQQENGSDCGMFCIKFIEILSADKDVTILKAQDMGFIRKKFTVETWKIGMLGM